MSLLSATPSQPQSTPSTSKRPPSPEPHRRREESRAPDYGPPIKRARGGSRERDRERWDGPSRRRYNSPGWDRDRDRESSARRSMREEREDEKPPTIPPVLSWFVGMLPAPGIFDGVSAVQCDVVRAMCSCRINRTCVQDGRFDAGLQERSDSFELECCKGSFSSATLPRRSVRLVLAIRVVRSDSARRWWRSTAPGLWSVPRPWQRPSRPILMRHRLRSVVLSFLRHTASLSVHNSYVYIQYLVAHELLMR